MQNLHVGQTELSVVCVNGGGYIRGTEDKNTENCTGHTVPTIKGKYLMAYVANAPRTAFAPARFVATVAENLSVYRTRRAAFKRTLAELDSLNDRELSDLGLTRFMIEDVAREAARRAA